MAAERGLIGALLLGGREAYGRVTDVVDPDAIVESRHRTIYIAVSAVAERGEPIDGITVANELDNRGELAIVGGTEYLAELVETTASATNICAYAHIVADHAAAIARPSTNDDRTTRGRNVATHLVELAESRYMLGVTSTGEPYGVPRAGPRVAVLLRGGRSSLRAELALAYYRATGRAASASALADAMLALEGAAHEAEPEDLHVRVAAADGDIYLDIGDTAGRAIKVTADGWSMVDQPPMLFRRSALIGALPEPVRGGSIDELWQHVRAAEPDRPLVLAWGVAAMIVDIPHPVLGLFGEHGTAKTTSMRMLASLIDPSPAATRKPPRDAEAWVTAAAGSWIVPIDNLSTVADWLSDALCRAVTGEGDVRRRLYADRDLEVWAYRRAIIVSAIDLGALRGDLADRMLPVDLDRIAEAERRPESAIWPAWDAARPRIIGALLDLAGRVLAELPVVELDRMPRMADFARVLAAVDRVLGTHGLHRYAGRVRSIIADSVSSDPFGAAIIEGIAGDWSGTAAELLKRLAPFRTSRQWPGSARAVTARLRRHAPGLRAAGWGVSKRSGHAGTLRWRLIPPARDGGYSRPPKPPSAPQPSRSTASNGGIAPANAHHDPIDSGIGQHPDGCGGGRSHPARTNNGAGFGSDGGFGGVEYKPSPEMCPRCDDEGCSHCQPKAQL